MRASHRRQLKRLFATTIAAVYGACVVPGADGYAFNLVVPDVRQPASISGGSACPVRSHIRTASGSRAMRWSTALSTSPLTVITQDQSAAGRLIEMEQVITQSLGVWGGVRGSSLGSVTTSLARTATENACGSDGVNSICFDQADFAFTPGVLAFTRVLVADQLGVQIGSGAPATEIGEILDADIYFNPSDSSTSYATPAALAGTPRAYDLASLLTHEIGHTLGFSHSAVWDAMMFPYAPTPGTFNGTRASAGQPDAPLGEDDRTGLRVLYPDTADSVRVGSIRGRILNANPLSLPQAPPGVTGVYGAQVVAVDSDSGAVVAAAMGGWSCGGAGPAQFDGTYVIERLPIGHNYLVYAEPLNGAVNLSQISSSNSLCRNPTTDAGWPVQQACVTPTADISFTVRTRPTP